MGLFDRSSSSTQNLTENTAIDRRVVADGQSQVVGDGSIVSTTNNLQTTDLGAIEQAMQFGHAALGTIDRSNQRVLDTADSLFGQVNASVGKVLDQAAQDKTRAASALTSAASLVKDAFTSATDANNGNRTLVMTGLVIAGLVAAMAFTRSRA